MEIKWQKVLIWTVEIAIGALIYFFLIIFVLGWMRCWNPWMDDGPFTGSPRAACPQTKADQEFKIYGGNILYVYEPTEKEFAPTVALRNSKDEVQWCIYANGWEDSAVQTLRFTEFRQFPFTKPRVRGYVEWTYGHEAMWWFISSDGELKEYWYSW